MWQQLTHQIRLMGLATIVVAVAVPMCCAVYWIAKVPVSGDWTWVAIVWAVTYSAMNWPDVLRQYFDKT